MHGVISYSSPIANTKAVRFIGILAIAKFFKCCSSSKKIYLSQNRDFRKSYEV